jgi:hypothetical protein
VIVLGDFNFSEQHPEYQVFTGLTGMRDVGAAIDRRIPTVDSSLFYRRHSRKSKRIDMIFVRDGRERGLRPLSLDRVFDETIDFEGRAGGYSNHAGVMAVVELSGTPGAAPLPLRRSTIEMASQLLAEGRMDAQRRREGGRNVAGAGLVCALIAAGGLRGRHLSRRRFLRSSLRTAAVVALTPALGFSVMLSEVVAPDEIDAFDDAAERLARFESEADELLQS